MSITKSLKGADIKVYINSKVYPVTGLRWSSTTGRKAIGGIDSSTPFELTSGMTSLKGSIEVLRIRRSGGLEGAGILPTDEYILQEKYFTLTVIDRLSDSVILQINEAAVVEQNWNISAKTIITGSFGFEGINSVNEVNF